MRKQITICNRCETQIEGDATLFSLFSERRMDPAGACENWHWTADLCSMCTRILVAMLLKRVDSLWDKDERKALATEFKAIEQ